MDLTFKDFNSVIILEPKYAEFTDLIRILNGYFI